MFQGWGWKGGRRRCLWGSPGRWWHLSPRGRSDSFIPGKPDLTLQHCLTSTENDRRNRKHERHTSFSKTFSRWRVHGSSESSFDHHAWTSSIMWLGNPGYWELETLKTVSCQISKLGGGGWILMIKNNSEEHLCWGSLSWGQEPPVLTASMCFCGPLDTFFKDFFLEFSQVLILIWCILVCNFIIYPNGVFQGSASRIMLKYLMSSELSDMKKVFDFSESSTTKMVLTPYRWLILVFAVTFLSNKHEWIQQRRGS